MSFKAQVMYFFITSRKKVQNFVTGKLLIEYPSFNFSSKNIRK